MGSPPSTGRPTLIVAVDGVLVDSLPLRRDALAEAARTVGLAALAASVCSNATVAGRSWREAARLLAGPDVDETLLDLTALAAERALQARLAREAWLLIPEGIEHCQAAVERGWRVLLRADTTRRAAGPLLEFLMTETGAARCSAGDDLPTTVDRDTLIERQYRVIKASATSQLPVISREATTEASDRARSVIPDIAIGWPDDHAGD